MSSASKNLNTNKASSAYKNEFCVPQCTKWTWANPTDNTLKQINEIDVDMVGKQTTNCANFSKDVQARPNESGWVHAFWIVPEHARKTTANAKARHKKQSGKIMKEIMRTTG